MVVYDTIIINLFCGPGGGKSTMAARVFADLKELGINAELVTEYAKDLTWQRSLHVLENQLYIFAKQHHRIWRVFGKVDVIVTDSPYLMGLAYAQNASEHFKNLIVEEHRKHNSINVFLQRVKPYNPIGRNQDEAGARELDRIIQETVAPYLEFDMRIKGEKASAQEIVNLALLRLRDKGPDISKLKEQ